MLVQRLQSNSNGSGSPGTEQTRRRSRTPVTGGSRSVACCRVLVGCTAKAKERAHYLVSLSRTAHPAAVCAATGCLLQLRLPSIELVLRDSSTLGVRAEQSRAVLLVERQAVGRLSTLVQTRARTHAAPYAVEAWLCKAAEAPALRGMGTRVSCSGMMRHALYLIKPQVACTQVCSSAAKVCTQVSKPTCSITSTVDWSTQV